VVADVAVMIADSGEAIADIAVLADQRGLHGSVGSSAACWRVLKAVADQGQAGSDLGSSSLVSLNWALIRLGSCERRRLCSGGGSRRV